jgi:16S rRNA (guanine527-N7)-methyltransferase
MTTPSFAEVEKFGVSRESLERLIILEKLLLTWQTHINLISPATIPDLWNRHFVDSLQILPLIPKATKAIADLGSGGGFPGLVLAATQNAEVHFYESNTKKTAFLQEALRHMKIKGSVHRQRLEPMQAPREMPNVQLVTARAFAPLPLLLSLAEPFMRDGAKALFHKGQECHNELNEAAKSWKISYDMHPSVTDSHSVILEIKEIAHV